MMQPETSWAGWIMVGLFFLVGVVLALVWVVMVAVVGVRLMRLCRGAGVPHGWFGFLPILAETRMARLAGANPWWNVLAVIPIANLIWIVLIYLWTYRIAARGDHRIWWWVTLLVPIAVLALSNVTLGDLYWALALGSIAIIGVARWCIFDPSMAERFRVTVGGGEADPAIGIDAPIPSQSSAAR